MKHTTHPEIIKRLKRAEGHMRSTIAMLEADRPCLDIAQQLHAIEAAVAKAKKELIHDHVEHCLEDTARDGSFDARAALKDIRILSKYL